jgi:hypothetical protein
MLLAWADVTGRCWQMLLAWACYWQMLTVCWQTMLALQMLLADAAGRMVQRLK